MFNASGSLTFFLTIRIENFSLKKWGKEEKIRKKIVKQAKIDTFRKLIQPSSGQSRDTFFQKIERKFS